MTIRKFEKIVFMEAAATGKKTIQDYLQLPEGAPYELLDGCLVKEPAPNRYHQKLIGTIFRLIANWCVEKNLGEVYLSPFDVYLDEENVVQPDILFFSTSRLHVLSYRGAEGAPDLIIEILSPSNKNQDKQYKRSLYEKYGVQEYFIADPEDGLVIAYYLQDGRYKEQYREKNLIRSEVLQTEINW